MLSQHACQLQRFSTPMLHEAMAMRGALPFDIRPLSGSMRLCGRALTVYAGRGSNYFVHKAVYSASPHDVLVIKTDSEHIAGYWGELLTLAARSARLAGVVLGGHLRDSAEILSLGFPIFSRGTCLRGTSKEVLGHVGQPVRLGETFVETGDVVVGDADGVVVVGSAIVNETFANATERESNEAEWRRGIDRGERLIDLILPGGDSRVQTVPPATEPTE